MASTVLFQSSPLTYPKPHFIPFHPLQSSTRTLIGSLRSSSSPKPSRFTCNCNATSTNNLNPSPNSRIEAANDRFFGSGSGFDVVIEKILGTLKGLRKPAVAIILMGLLLMYDPNSSALAASGGRVGGSAFTSRSTSSSRSSSGGGYSTSTRIIDPGVSFSAPYYAPTPFGGGGYFVGPAFGVGIGVGSNLLFILMGFAAFVLVSGVLSERDGGSVLAADSERTTVLKLQSASGGRMGGSSWSSSSSDSESSSSSWFSSSDWSSSSSSSDSDDDSLWAEALAEPIIHGIVEGFFEAWWPSSKSLSRSDNSSPLKSPPSTSSASSPPTPPSMSPTSPLSSKSPPSPSSKATSPPSNLKKSVSSAASLLSSKSSSSVSPSSSTKSGSTAWRTRSILISVVSAVVGACVYFFRPATKGTNTAVFMCQVGLLGMARSLQEELNRIARAADTSTPQGLNYILTETTLALLRNPDYWISAYSSVDVKKSIDAGEKRFNQLSIEERGKFDEETLVNVNNIKKQSSSSQKPGGFSNEYIVVTVLVAAEGVHKLPIINGSNDLKEALEKLGSIPSNKTMAVEVLWTPQDVNDTLTERELLKDYSLLRPL